MRKRICLLALFLLIVAFLTGCGNDSGAHDAFTRYEAGFSIIVSNTSAGGKTGISSSNLAAERPFVESCVTVMKSSSVLEQVIEKSGYALSADQLSNMLYFDIGDETSVIHIRVVSDSSAFSLDIAQAMAEAIPQSIEDIMEDVSVRLLDSPLVVEIKTDK